MFLGFQGLAGGHSGSYSDEEGSGRPSGGFGHGKSHLKLLSQIYKLSRLTDLPMMKESKVLKDSGWGRAMRHWENERV